MMSYLFIEGLSTIGQKCPFQKNTFNSFLAPLSAWYNLSSPPYPKTAISTSNLIAATLKKTLDCQEPSVAVLISSSSQRPMIVTSSWKFLRAKSATMALA